MAILSGWRDKILDINFIAEGTNTPQTFNSNTTYSIGGYTWTKINTSAEVTNGTKVDSNGLLFSPNNTADYGFSNNRAAAALLLPVSSLVPHARLGMGLRLWAYNSTNTGNSNFDAFCMVVEQPTASPTTTSNQMVYCIKRGYNTNDGSSGGTVLSSHFQGTLSGSSVLDTGTITDQNTDNVLMIEIPQLGSPDISYYTGVWSTTTGWPTFNNMHLQYYNYNAAGVELRTNAAVLSQWNIVLSGISASVGSHGFTCRCAQFRVDTFLP